VPALARLEFRFQPLRFSLHGQRKRMLQILALLPVRKESEAEHRQ
jgi:hypothetical protein